MIEPVQLPDAAALGPALVLGLTALVVFVFDSARPHEPDRGLLAGTTAAGSLLALGVGVWYMIAGVGVPEPDGAGVISLFDGQLVVDQLALFFMLVTAIVTALVAIASYDYMDGHAHQGEYYSLVLLAATGMATMAAANSLVTVFLALELASLPSYALVAILKDNRGSVEAGLKYFLLGALSSAIFVYGISLVYGATGVLQLDLVAEAITGETGQHVLTGNAHDVAGHDGLLGVGIVLLLVGIAFKTASVPLHFWAPEAYEGAPAPIAAFLSSASKAAGFVIAIRVFTTAFPVEATAGLVGFDWSVAFAVLAVATMTIGNFAAAVQENVKRMLAYSSVGHAGYALIGLAGVGAGANELVLGAALMHLFVYAFMNTGAFLFVALAEYWGVGRTFADYNGLGRRAPIACVALTVFMFSLAGIPPLGGFLSKYLLFWGSLQAGMLFVAGALVVNSALSLYYYSRLVKAVWFEEPVTDHGSLAQPVGLYAALIAAAVMTVVVLPGFGPIADSALDAATAVLTS
ncbi:NAD(P)H-quinone oxidoreductase subunit 2 [Halovivax asiaticus JCM 14624]|uniref:NAD(P)H-quinone oxidoreductase subunit 2 n=1 Tax=Halovivax asiaticus JCM 14624 TaxID=1227490 RepID=M0BSK0_9EURY|nr:NAD(P)H-quinone oxidoreductase subunit 2 [Halovivax asiaticus JCM 14624]